MKIKVPRIIWALGDPEQTTTSGVTVITRPLYYFPEDVRARAIRIGTINPDYAEPLMTALGKDTR